MAQRNRAAQGCLLLQEVSELVLKGPGGAQGKKRVLQGRSEDIASVVPGRLDHHVGNPRDLAALRLFEELAQPCNNLIVCWIYY